MPGTLLKFVPFFIGRSADSTPQAALSCWAERGILAVCRWMRSPKDNRRDPSPARKHGGFRMTDGSNFAIRVEGDLTDDASLTYKPFSGYWGGASALSAEAQE